MVANNEVRFEEVINVLQIKFAFALNELSKSWHSVGIVVHLQSYF